MPLNIWLTGKHTGVHKLNGGDGTVLIDRIGNGCKVGHTVVAVEFEIFGDIHTMYGIDVCLPYMDNSAAAARLALVVCHQGLGRDILDCKVAVTGRSCKDPVA